MILLHSVALRIKEALLNSITIVLLLKLLHSGQVENIDRRL